MHRAPHEGPNPRRVQLNASRSSFIGATFAAALPREAARQDAELDGGVEFGRDEPGQLSAGAGLGEHDDAGRVPSHQAVPCGVPGAVALIVDQCAMRRRPALPAGACTKGSQGGEPARSHAACRASIAQTADCLCVPLDMASFW